MAQQAQNQDQEQAIQLSKSGKSYRYQGRNYFLKKEYYRVDTTEWFWEKCYNMHLFQQQIQLQLNEPLFPFTKSKYQRQLIYQRVERIFVINRNFHIILKHYGMRYLLNGNLSTEFLSNHDKHPFVYWVMWEAKDLLDWLTSIGSGFIATGTGEYKKMHNQGIREALLSIHIIKEHLTFKREKMTALLPRLLGYRVDDNVGSIISQYCF
jgi:hypothetical protein